MNREEVFKRILDCCFRIHTLLGPGLLESAYEEWLRCLHILNSQVAGLGF